MNVYFSIFQHASENWALSGKMAAEATRLPVGVNERVEQYGVAMPHFVVQEDYDQFPAAFLRTIATESEIADDEPRITPAEVAYIRDNTQIIPASIHCFTDSQVYPFEFPEHVSIPVALIGATVNKKILVVLYKFVCSTSYYLNCYFFGFVFADDMALRSIPPHNTEVFMLPGHLKSVFQLISAVRQRKASVPACNDDVNTLEPSQSSEDVPMHAVVADDPATMRSNADILIANIQPNAIETFVPGPYIFCSLDACAHATFQEGAVVMRDQVVWRMRSRIVHYRYMNSDGSRPLTKHEQRRIDCGLFWSTSPNDLHHEMLVVLSLVIVFKRRMDYLLPRELQLMRVRITHKLSSKEARTQFMHANRMYDAYVAHQAVCTHEKFECFERFVLETYESTLTRLGRITDYILHDMPEAEARASDEPTLDLLAQIVDCAVDFLRINFDR